MWPLDAENEALGLLLKRWLLPLLVWNVPAFRILYQHEWEYILFLLGQLGYEEEINWVFNVYFFILQALDLEEKARKELEGELDIVPLQKTKLNPDFKFEVEGEAPFTFYELKERF